MASVSRWRHSTEGRNARRWFRALHPKGSPGYIALKRAARKTGRCWVELAHETMQQEEAAVACKPSDTPPS